MNNDYMLRQVDLDEIEALTEEQLRQIRSNLQIHKFDGHYNDQTARDAITEYVADGGDIADLLPEPRKDEHNKGFTIR